MTAEMITLRIFVMGLAAVLTQPGGKLEIVLPSAKDHVPVLVYPCGKPGCKGDAENVASDLKLPPENSDTPTGLLVFKDSYFGAVELNGVEIQLPKPAESLASSAARPLFRGGRRHPWYSNWWFHWRGEVPASNGESSNVSWLPSLTDIAPCAAQLKSDDDMVKVLAAYLRSSVDELGLPEVASVGSMLEFKKGYCSEGEDDALSDYATSLSFRNTLWPFASPNQAVADSIVFTIKVPKSPITLKKPDGTLTISLDACEANRTVDILIGNLVPLSGDFNRACITSGLPHVHHYQYLLNNPNCVLPTPRLAWLSTRTEKTVLQQTGDSVPPVIRVVSEQNPKSGSAGGYARPLCFMVTN